MTIPQAFAVALQRHQTGQLAEAEALYRQILAAQPNHADALHHLGVVAHQVGRHELAVEWIRQAIALAPDHPAAHCNLGEACRAAGRLPEAVAAFQRALELKPGYADAHNNLGNALKEQGRLDDAIAAYRRALELKPDFPEAFNNLGAALAAQGRLDEAVAAYRRALALNSNAPALHFNLAKALSERGPLDEAVAALRRALELKPDYPEAHNYLGNTLAKQGRFDEAVAAFHRALELQPDDPTGHNNLGNALAELGRFDAAITTYRRALELQPGLPETHNNLAKVWAVQGKLDEAVATYHRAIALRPDYPDGYNNLGNALVEQGELDKALAAYRRALQMKPENACAHSNLIFALHFHPGHHQRTISDEHQRWNRQFSEPIRQFPQPHANDRNPERPLRIGYVSPDFRDHPVGHYLLPLLERHDREQFQIHCYSGVTQPDPTTAHIRGLTAKWQETLGVSDTRLAKIIREDRVDILVDLSLHTAGNRLPMFTHQPAPVQVTWLGYPGSTGLPAIGYRFTDVHLDPPGEDARWSAEEPVRLPDCWCCYQPADELPEINPLPALSAQAVTFGSLNNFAKVNEGVLALWARMLSAVKGSRLLMFCPEGRTRERVLEFFDTRGIVRGRVEMAGFLPRAEYLKLYQRIDVGLDPFPCNGMTTTCDALWMGAPVLTFPGTTPVSRAGDCLLSTVGLDELVAHSEDDYVRIAFELAGNLPRLADLRANLRPRMLASRLMDATRFTRDVEAAYRSMWERWRVGESTIREK